MITVVPRIRTVPFSESFVRKSSESYSWRRCAVIWVVLSVAAWTVMLSAASALASVVGIG